MGFVKERVQFFFRGLFPEPNLYRMTPMDKVAKLDVSKLDEHEMSCGRTRKSAEVIRVSGDPDFFLGADPLEVCWYITEAQASGDTASNRSISNSSGNGGNTALGDALKRAGF